MSDWKWRLLLFVPSSSVTSDIKRDFARAFSDNGSGESEANELAMFDAIMRLSVTGNAPTQAFGINTLAKAAMRDDLKALISSLGNSHWYVMANVELPNWDIGELIQSSRNTVDDRIGSQFGLLDALSDLGIQRIVSDVP